MIPIILKKTSRTRWKARSTVSQVFVKRQKTLGYQAKNYLNLIRFTRHLLRLPTGDAKLRADIEAASALAEKGWRLGKL